MFHQIFFWSKHCNAEILYFYGLFQNSQLGRQSHSDAINQSFASSHVGCGSSFAPHINLWACSTFGLKTSQPLQVKNQAAIHNTTRHTCHSKWAERKPDRKLVLSSRRQLSSMPQPIIVIAISYVRYSSTSIVTGGFKCTPRPDSGPAKACPPPLPNPSFPTQFL